MGIENKLQVLMTPEDALSLCDGFFKDRAISCKILNENNVLDAAQTLIEIGHENGRPYISKCDVLETALRMGWFPRNYPQETIAPSGSFRILKDWSVPLSLIMFGFVLFILATAATGNTTRLLFAFSSGAFISLGISQLSRGSLEEGDRDE